MIMVEIFRRSMLWRFPLKNHLVGLYTGKVAQLLENSQSIPCDAFLLIGYRTSLDTALDLTDEKGDTIMLRIKIKLSLISESPEVFMRSVDADVARLNGN